MSHFSIAGLQLATSNGNNLEHVINNINASKKRFPWLDMLILPELAVFGAATANAEPANGVTEQQLCEVAKANNVWLVTGSMFEQAYEHIYNTCCVINNEGHVVDRYRKIYPFLPYEKGVTSGDRIVVVEVPQGKIGIAICYDLWFPEVARAMVVQGAECLIYPTMTGTIDRPLELAMAKATAVQNQCYLFSINCAGELGNGQSTVIGPDGDEIYTAGPDEECIPVEIDFARVRRNRECGVLGLGQPLKSFRDNPMHFAQYDKSLQAKGALAELGPLVLVDKANIDK